MPMVPNDMSDAAIKRRAEISETTKAKAPDVTPPPPKPRIAKKR